MVAPTRCGSMPRRLVSTSGNSGIASPGMNRCKQYRGKQITKNPAGARIVVTSKREILDIRFFVDHVLTNNWIEFFQFQFFRLSTFVLRSGIEVTSTSRRNQLDFLTNTFRHDLFPLST